MDENGQKRLCEEEPTVRIKRKMVAWSQKDVSTCTCEELAYRHSHCPCQNCNGKAVSSSTEYSHWERNNLFCKVGLNLSFLNSKCDVTPKYWEISRHLIKILCEYKLI